jgi:hypothetical protein
MTCNTLWTCDRCRGTCKVEPGSSRPTGWQHVMATGPASIDLCVFCMSALKVFLDNHHPVSPRPLG